LLIAYNISFKLYYARIDEGAGKSREETGIGRILITISLSLSLSLSRFSEYICIIYYVISICVSLDAWRQMVTHSREKRREVDCG